jgi:hypothetical protein
VYFSGTASQFMKFEMEIGVPPLPAGPAKKLAATLMPEGADDLVKAGRRLAGEMAFLAQYADLGTVRMVSRRAKGKDDFYAMCHETVHQVVGADLTADEKVVAASLLRGTAPFDTALAWSLTADAVKKDKVGPWAAVIALSF